MKITVNGTEHEHEGDLVHYDDIATIVALMLIRLPHTNAEDH